MKASDLFVRCLEAEGVTVIFGVPGEENVDLLMALKSSPIEFVGCRHEQGAAFMADIHGRLTGEPGVCLSTLGPGATNLVTGVANANFDRSPVVAITGQASTHRLHKESHQNMDAVSMFKPVTKWNATVASPDNIPEVIRKAFKIARTEKPGATHIELPEDVAKLTTSKKPLKPLKSQRRPAADPRSVTQALELIAKARSPIILAGNGCIRKSASEQLRALVEKTGIHAVNTFMGKGALPAHSPFCLYSAGLASRDHVTEAFERADLVITIGYDMIEWHPDRWNLGRNKAIIHIDFESAEVDEHYQPDVEIIGDLESSIQSLIQELGPEHRKADSLFSRIRSQVTEELHEFDEDESFPMKPQRILADLRAEMDGDDILISDVGAHKMWVARNYPVHTPGTCIISNGFCSMGIAVPGAISAKRLYPDRAVVGLVGDGGFLMNIQELATASEYGIPAVFLIWEDGGYGLIAWKQQVQFGTTAFTEFKNPDLVQIAQSFGCHGVRLTSHEQLRPALREAFRIKDRPSVILVPVDYSENLKLTRRLGEIIGH